MSAPADFHLAPGVSAGPMTNQMGSGIVKATDRPVIHAMGLVKRYGPRVALRGIDLEARAGDRIALLGPNGAGKTTLLRVLALLTRPTSGFVRIGGFDAVSEPQEIRARIGVCLHESLLYSDLTVRENLEFFGRLYRVRELDGRIRILAERLELTRLLSTRVRQLSRGQRQRTSLARALIHDPPVLLLDEADTGQDLASLARMQAELTSAPARTVVFATHQPSQAISLATRVLILRGGRAFDFGAAPALCARRLEEALLAAGG